MTTQQRDLYIVLGAGAVAIYAVVRRKTAQAQAAPAQATINIPAAQATPDYLTYNLPAFQKEALMLPSVAPLASQDSRGAIPSLRQAGTFQDTAAPAVGASCGCEQSCGCSTQGQGPLIAGGVAQLQEQFSQIAPGIEGRMLANLLSAFPSTTVQSVS
jgi:hypothetical protein